MKTYQRSEVLNITGLELERLNSWVAHGYINASFEEKKGNRVFREFTILDVYSITAFRHMVDSRSFSRDDAGEIIKVWKSYVEDHPEELNTGLIYVHVLEIDGEKHFQPDKTVNLEKHIFPVLRKQIKYGQKWYWRHSILINLKDDLNNLNFNG